VKDHLYVGRRGDEVVVDAERQSAIAPGLLRPYVSLMFLECTSEHEHRAFVKLVGFMKDSRGGRSRSCDVVRSGFTDINRYRRSATRPHGVDQIDGFVYRLQKRPAWATGSAPFQDVQHALAIALRRGKLIAVSGDQSLRDAVGRWLKDEPRPPFRLVSAALLSGAFVGGETKRLWLRGTHRRTTLRPDSKQLSGMRLEDTLNALEDSSFAMSAVRSKLPEDLSEATVFGAVGTSPRKGTMWLGQTEDFSQFMTFAIAALNLLEDTRANGDLLARPFPILAEESHDLTQVHGAFDIATLTPDDIPIRSDVSDEVIRAAEILERATFNVIASPRSADFQFEVGLDGSMDGRVDATVRMQGDRVIFSFGPGDRITNPGRVRAIIDALNAGEDLFCVYYDSGHVVWPHGIGRRNVNPMPFANWRFLDFSGFDISTEKPSRVPAEIHALTGCASDTSLFGWTARHYSTGVLICDDGPGEVADFLHISEDSMLSLIHVKSADSAGPSRGIAVTPFEVVAGQAVKNSRLLIEPDQLLELVDMPHGSQRASWVDGKRVPGRSEFLARLDGLPLDKRQIVIVQPHVSEATYQRIRPSKGSGKRATPQEQFRLRMLETLLITARASIVALGADLHVIGSKT
jgi:hypothetical protein